MNKQKNQSGSVHVIVGIVLIIVLLGLLGFVYWKNFIQVKSVNVTNSNELASQKSKTPVDDIKVKPANSAEDGFVIKPESGITAEMIVPKIYSAVYDKYASKNLKIEYKVGTEASPVYRPDGIDYKVVSNSGSTVVISQVGSASIQNISSKLASGISDFFINSKLAKILVSNKSSCGGRGDVACYASATTICSVSSDGSSNENITYYHLSCANISDYSFAITAIRPFAQAYLAGSSYANSDTIYGMPKIKNSLSIGYQYAEVSIGQMANGLFYKKDGSDWKYFKSVQNNPCSIFDTDESKTAFSGFVCYDSAAKKDIVLGQ